MNKELLKKTGFVVLLLVLGFSLEYLFYSKSKKIPSEAKATGTKRILLVGGSILDSITPGLKSVIQNNKLKDFEIINLTVPLMSSENALRILSEQISQLEPDMVFLLLGMHERKPGNVLSLERRKKLLHFVRDNDSAGLNNYIIALINEILNEKNAIPELANLHMFLHMKDIINLRNPETLAPEIVKILAKEMNAIPLNETRLNLLFTLSENLLIDRSRLRTDEFSNFLSYFDEFLDNKKDHTGKDFFIATDYLWRKKLSEMAGQEDLRDTLLRSPGLLQAFGRRIYLFNQWKRVGKSEIDGRVVQMIDGIKNRHLEVGLYGEFPEEKMGQFVKNLSLIKALLDDKKIPVSLLQYPNTSLQFLKEAGRESNIRVLENKEAFGNVITTENYFKYFIDRTGETGHLTDLGSEIYARSLESQLPEIFNSSP